MARVSWGLPSRLSTLLELEAVGTGEEVAQLLQRAGVEISIHIDAAERPFNGVDPAVLIAVQLLKMVMGQIECLWTRDAGRRGSRARIVALGIFEHAIGNQIRPRLYYDFGSGSLGRLHRPAALSACGRRLSRGDFFLSRGIYRFTLG